jgi:hypothetical protein
MHAYSTACRSSLLPHDHEVVDTRFDETDRTGVAGLQADPHGLPVYWLMFTDCNVHTPGTLLAVPLRVKIVCAER